MALPFVSYSTFDRMGLTARSLHSVLNTTDDFELHIIDNHSKDDTWDFIMSLDDPRIKSRTRFEVNVGPIYAVNFSLQKRHPEQFFFALESDVCIHTPDWVSRFMKVFGTFPEVGLLGLTRADPYPVYLPDIVLRQQDGAAYYQLKNGTLGVPMDFIPGHCQCLRPELIGMIGHWCEENGYGDAELAVRVCNYTPFKAGFVTDVSIDMTQRIPCDQCECRQFCKLDKVTQTCFDIRNSRYKNESFAEAFRWKYLEYFNELQRGERTAYCASIHNPDSQRDHIYHADWAQENFNFYIKGTN